MLCLSLFAADVSKGCCKLPRNCLDQVPTPWPLCGWRTLLHFAAVRELCLDLEAEALPRTQRDAVPFLVPPGSQVCLAHGSCPSATMQQASSVMRFAGCLAQAFKVLYQAPRHRMLFYDI